MSAAVTEGERMNCRVLIVEDEAIIAMDLEMMLQDEGCDVVATVSSVKAALEQIGQHEIDCAFLDINLGHEQVFPVADALAKKGVPFALLSGHTKAVVPPAHLNRPALPKPYLKKDVLKILEQLQGNATSA
jgi:two-component SAPR family response regulator